MKYFFPFGLALLALAACTGIKNSQGKRDDGKIEIRFIQVNDVYEIAPLSGGREGGVARIATLKRNSLRKNPNTFLVIAGDFLSPSVFNSIQYEGKPVRGQQMVDALNAAGTDFACFGNHEFDIRENELQQRIDESKFQWISSNTFHKTSKGIMPFKKNGGMQIPSTYILTINDDDGTTARIGFIGICLPFNKADYVSYTDPLEAAKKSYNQIKDSVDAVVAITHQQMEDDEKLAAEIPGLAMILGGHEHDQRFKKVGRVYITKAMANAKSAYVLDLKINKKRNKIKVDPELRVLDESIPPDSATSVIVSKWSDIAEKNYQSLGFNARRVIRSTGEPLDGRELVIRSQPTNLGKLVAEAMAAAVPEAEVAIMNSGSIRVDDILHMPITEYDIIRTLPFGGAIREVDLKGSLLIRILEQGKKNVGQGGFLLYNSAVKWDLSGWSLKNVPIEPTKVYRVAIADFLLSGKEANLEFIQASNPEIIKIYDAEKSVGNVKSDIRLAVIRYMDKSN